MNQQSSGKADWEIDFCQLKIKLAPSPNHNLPLYECRKLQLKIADGASTLRRSFPLHYPLNNCVILVALQLFAPRSIVWQIIKNLVYSLESVDIFAHSQQDIGGC